jgi:hypothetical protein
VRSAADSLGARLELVVRANFGRALTAAMIIRCGGPAGTRCAALPGARTPASCPGSMTLFSARRLVATLHFFL